MRPVLLVHGGSGNLSPALLSGGREARYRAGLVRALEAGYAALTEGGGSLEAVVTAVGVLEDDPLFNAGRGAVLDRSGGISLDASVMEGRERRAGAVCGVRGVRNPARLAAEVMARTPHVMLDGAGAEAAARAWGLAMEPPDWFYTEERRASLERLLAEEGARETRAVLDHEGGGTVGAVAVDAAGHLAAATSTGGMTGKQPGRVGDSAVIGAGTWAWDNTCAVSATGQGEAFIRAHAAARISDLMELGGLSLEQAARQVVEQEVVALGGRGGVIAVDGWGRSAMPFTTTGMFRGRIGPGGALEVRILES